MIIVYIIVTRNSQLQIIITHVTNCSNIQEHKIEQPKATKLGRTPVHLSHAIVILVHENELET